MKIIQKILFSWLIEILQLISFGFTFQLNGKMFDAKDVSITEAFAIFCGIGIHNTKTYESACKMMAKQVDFQNSCCAFVWNSEILIKSSLSLIDGNCRRWPWIACLIMQLRVTMTQPGSCVKPSRSPRISISTAINLTTCYLVIVKLWRLYSECLWILIYSTSSQFPTK